LQADGRRALSASNDHTLKLWDLDTCEVPRTLKGHLGSVNAATLLADAHYVLSASADTNLKLWNLVTGEVLAACHRRRRPNHNRPSCRMIAMSVVSGRQTSRPALAQVKSAPAALL
jgi:WD40 repeat protein